jgi:CheY-specific phosphatase CheX
MVGENAANQRAASVSLVDGLAGDSITAVSLVDGLVRSAAEALFQTYGVKLEPDGTPLSRTLKNTQLLGVIGFSSRDLSGALLMALPRALVERTLPAPDANPGDWCGELTNQLLGRLKNQLLKYQVAVNLSLPVVVCGEGMSLPASTRKITRYCSYACDGLIMCIRIEMELGPSLELVRKVAEPEHEAVDEGELLLF